MQAVPEHPTLTQYLSAFVDPAATAAPTQQQWTQFDWACDHKHWIYFCNSCRELCAVMRHPSLVHTMPNQSANRNAANHRIVKLKQCAGHDAAFLLSAFKCIHAFMRSLSRRISIRSKRKTYAKNVACDKTEIGNAEAATALSSNGPQTVHLLCVSVFSNEWNTEYRAQNINFESANRLSAARGTLARLQLVVTHVPLRIAIAGQFFRW